MLSTLAQISVLLKLVVLGNCVELLRFPVSFLDLVRKFGELISVGHFDFVLAIRNSLQIIPPSNLTNSNWIRNVRCIVLTAGSHVESHSYTWILLRLWSIKACFSRVGVYRWLKLFILILLFRLRKNRWCLRTRKWWLLRLHTSLC